MHRDGCDPHNVIYESDFLNKFQVMTHSLIMISWCSICVFVVKYHCGKGVDCQHCQLNQNPTSGEERRQHQISGSRPSPQNDSANLFQQQQVVSNPNLFVPLIFLPL